MDLISVIVPVYNVEKYLAKCIDSILKQTYSNLEIILVDDGSTDNSNKICKEYEKLDKRIRVIHKKNGGLSDARNYGLTFATGDYISFIDSDDYIEKNMYELLLNALKNNNGDMAVCGRWIEKEEEQLELYTKDREEVWDSIQALKYYFKRIKIDPSACDKLFKKEILDNIVFPIGKIHEDIFIMDVIIARCKIIVHVGKPLYHYVNRQGSITKKVFSEKNFDYIEAHQEVFKRYLNNKILNSYAYSYYIESYIIIIDKMLTNKLTGNTVTKLPIYREFIKNNIITILLNSQLPLKRKVKSILIAYFWPIYKRKYTTLTKN